MEICVLPNVDEKQFILFYLFIFVCVFQDFALKDIHKYGRKPCNSTMDVELIH